MPKADQNAPGEQDHRQSITLRAEQFDIAQRVGHVKMQGLNMAGKPTCALV